MKISLKKANILAQEIVKEIKPLENTFDAQVITTPSDIIRAQMSQMAQHMKNTELITVLERFKIAIAYKNTFTAQDGNNSISSLLSKIKCIDIQLRNLEVALKAKPTPNDIEWSLNKFRELKPTQLGRYDTYPDTKIELFTEENITYFKNEITRLKLERIKALDEVAYLNHTLNIELCDNSVATLQKYQLI